MTPLEWLVAALCLVVVLALAVLVARDLRAGDRTVAALFLIEGLLVVHLLLGVVRFARDGQDVSGVTYIGYLIAALLILPAGFVWSASERNRGGTSVLLVAVLVVPFLMLRTHQVWSAGG